MPLTPERIWRAIRTASDPARLSSPWREPPAVFETLARCAGTGVAESEEADL
jgi:hypothetical protein